MQTLEKLQHLNIPPLSGGFSIGAHVLEVTKHKSCPVQSVKDLLGAHSIDDDIWGGTDPSDMSIDTTIRAEIMTGSHII